MTGLIVFLLIAAVVLAVHFQVQIQDFIKAKIAKYKGTPPAPPAPPAA